MKPFNPPKATGPVAAGAVVTSVRLTFGPGDPLAARVVYSLVGTDGKPLPGSPPQSHAVTAPADVQALAAKAAAGDVEQAVAYAEGLLG